MPRSSPSTSEITFLCLQGSVFDIKNVVGVNHKGPDTFLRHPGMEEELRELAEGGEEVVLRLKELVDGELDTWWLLWRKRKLVQGMVIV